MIRSCVLPEGNFSLKVHKPAFRVANLRENDYIQSLGLFEGGGHHENRKNFPSGEIEIASGAVVFEVPNFFPFRGTTYIKKLWADEKADDPARIRLPEPDSVSLTSNINRLLSDIGLSADHAERFFRLLPEPLRIALAQTSTDPDDLVRMAQDSCEFVYNPDTGRPSGLMYTKEESGHAHPHISNHDLYEVLANNRSLPEDYRRAMVLRPGAQGGSRIVGEWKNPDGKSHVFEYLRRNSYIPWGHYAANMADDAIRYRIEDLTEDDITGMRHLYYQRTYVRLAQEMGLASVPQRMSIPAPELENLRKAICNALSTKAGGNALKFNRTLWGWNFGFDFSASGYRLHASHQQIHQQYAMIPADVNAGEIACLPECPYAYGDLVEYFSAAYLKETGVCFFDALIRALRSNERMDGEAKKPCSLEIYSDENVMLFVPKAQTSQWELNLITLNPVGNIVEADQKTRRSIDFSILLATRILSGLGARMITSIEYSKRIDSPEMGQRLVYAFLPRLPESPGAFSETQLRWINGHYPEDFAIACRNQAERCMTQGSL